MQDPKICRLRAILTEALEHLQSALNLLDSASAPAQIGAHVDLAIHELYLAVAEAQIGDTVMDLDRSARIQ
jgi:hypothetical protein